MCPLGELQKNRTAQKTTVVLEQPKEMFGNRLLDMEPQQMHKKSKVKLGKFKHLPRLSTDTGDIAESVKNEDLTYKERRRREKEIDGYKAEYKELGKSDYLLTKKQIKDINLFKKDYGREAWRKEKISRSKLTREETIKNILEKGDYSNFENLDGVMRNVVASTALTKFMEEYNITKKSNPEKICEEIWQSKDGVSKLLDPGLRLGISLAQKTPGLEDMKDFFCRLDEAMSTAVMISTLTHRPSKTKVKLYYREKKAANPEEKADKAIVENKAQQIQIAKRLLLMQLSDFKKIQNDGSKEDWDKPVAVALSHCSRVVMTLPREDKTNGMNNAQKHAHMWRSILTTNGENLAQDNGRASSTHSVKRRKVSRADGGINADAHKSTKEKKVLFNLVGQRGMNCAIGGLGNAGVGKQTLSNDGSCGHFYSMYKKGDSTHYGTFLMGLESDAHGVKNQMGHTHDIHATPEKASSLGGQRKDEIGKKYGGRQCSLAHLTAEEINTWMNQLERYMDKMQRSESKEDQEHYNEVMTILAGYKMDALELSELREMLNER